MSELDGLVEPEPDETAATPGGGWRPEPWWAWTLALLALGGASLLAAGTVLSTAEFGTSLRPRGCDTSPLPGLGLLAATGLFLGLGLQVARLRWSESFLVWDTASLVLSLPIPLAALAGTLPGVLGCAAGRDIARLGLVGDALVGTSGIALAAAAASFVGVAIAGCAHVGWLGLDQGTTPPPGIVELAMQEAEALQADEAAARFHGVESGD